MIKLVYLLFAPGQAWDSIATAQRNFFLVLLLNPLPLMALGIGAEAYSLCHWGLLSTDVIRAKPLLLSMDVAQKFALLRLGGDIITLFFAAQMLHWIGDSFHLRTNYNDAFRVIAYSLGPVFCISHALDAIPYLNTWICWAVGILLAIYLLYHGIGMVMKPDQTKGFGLFLCTGLMLLILTGAANLMVQHLLRNKLLMIPTA